MAELSVSPDPGRPLARRRTSSIVTRLVAAFLLVGFVPIGILAALSLQEHSAEPVAEHREGAEESPASHAEAEMVMGVPIYVLELGVAAVSLVLGVAAALYIGRTIVRPVRLLESSMARVESGDLETSVAVTGDDEIGRLGRAFNRMIEGLRREAMVRDLFGQYVDAKVARLAIDQRGQLDAQVIECTVVFVDIRGFTSLAEEISPVSLVDTLNRYFERMLVAVEGEGGIVNKFGGDSLLAIFGSPLNPSPDHAARAVRAALSMRRAMVEFNREQAASGRPELRIGIAAATGTVVAGNVGGRRRLEYTVLGDPVNVAARLQELTAELDADLLVTRETVRLSGDAGSFRSVGDIAIRGRASPVHAFAVED